METKTHHALAKTFPIGTHVLVIKEPTALDKGDTGIVIEVTDYGWCRVLIDGAAEKYTEEFAREGMWFEYKDLVRGTRG